MRLQSRAPQQMASVLILVALLTLTRTDAGVIPGRWEKVDALPPGAHLELILRTGDEHIKGSFEKSDALSGCALIKRHFIYTIISLLRLRFP